MLLSGRGEVFGLGGEGEPRFVVRDPEDKLVYVVGHPAEGGIREAVARNGDRGIVVAQLEAASHVAAVLPGWKAVRVTLHLLTDADRLPRVPAGSVRLLEPSDSLDGLPPDLRSELRIAAGRSPIAAGLEDGRPVSFCYAAARTESLWDISIDTMEVFRNRGHAARCVSYMVERMGKESLRPVWGAEEWNRASLGLAARLGFSPMDEMVLFRPAGAPWRTSSTTTGTSTSFG
jgi:GNAT superfamily N-acetyltransferase